jgi:branched-subunit amino acid ABC-type transport system permease component
MVAVVLAVVTPANFLQQMEQGITLGAIYALIALGYTMVYGIIELINFAHGDVLMWSTVVWGRWASAAPQPRSVAFNSS